VTEHRHLKQLIRDRQARTGESYTTARRHVLARTARDGAPPLPAGLVKGYDEFGADQHRHSAVAAHLLRQAGVVAPHTGEPFSEAMVCGLAGGIGFMYAVFEYRDVPPVLTIVAQHHPEPWLESALNRLGIGYEEGRSSGPRAMAALDAALAEDRPVYASVGRPLLPWHGGDPVLATEPYGVVVAGSADGSLLVDDGAVAPYALPAAAFAAAWAAYKKGRHHRIVLSRPAAMAVPLADAVQAAVATTVAHLTGPVLGNSFDTNFGFSGMAKLASQLRDTRTKSGWRNRFGEPASFGAAVRRLYACLELEYTAPGATRPLYADFLDQAATVPGTRAADLRAAAALFRASGELWSRVAALAAEHAGEYAELCERQMMCRLTGRRDEELDARVEALGAARAPVDETLFDAWADLVDAAREREEQAVALLS
jgi:hypothetical protein